MVALFATAAGLSVANIYYVQPLLTAIASAFHIGSGTASVLATASTIGYAVGMALLVPLGDVTIRRRLVVVLLLITAAALAASAAAPNFAVLVAATVALSLAAVVGPILLPFAATLASPEQRGKVTGTVVSGVLLGVLLSRTAGGLVAQVGGWRSVYATASAVTVLLALTMARKLPKLAPTERMGYLPLLRSVVELMRNERTLRLRSAYGFLGFAAFSAFWTSSAFLLARPPYSFSEGGIGLFALVGAAGAYAARVTGRLTDRGKDHAATGMLLAAILVGWGFMILDGGHWLATLIVGVILLDLGVQGAHVTNLAVAYRLAPQARSRITTAYMTVYFFGGVLGSAASGAVYAAYGWSSVCLVGGAFPALALVIWCADSLAARRRSAAV